MFPSLLEWLRSLFLAYGSWGVFFISVAEEVIAPIPSTLVVMAAGFFLLPGDQTLSEVISRAWWVVALPAAMGISIGSLLMYGLAYWGGKPLIERWGRWLGIFWSEIEKNRDYFSKQYTDEVLIFFLRALPFFPNSALSTFCGLVRYPWKKFLTLTFFGVLIRAFVMSLVGWKVGEAYVNYASWFNQVENFILFGLVLVILFWFVKNRHKKSSLCN